MSVTIESEPSKTSADFDPMLPDHLNFPETEFSSEHFREMLLSYIFGPSVVKCDIFAPAGFWPRGQNPRRHPRIPRVYTYKEFQNVRK